MADPVPDHSTLSRFRAELGRRGLAEQLLAELNRQLDARGSMVKTGTLIDASLVEADGRRPKKGEPVERRSDRDASWNPMPEQPLFGCQMHLAVDQGSGLVRLKRCYGDRRVRYRSLVKNALQLQLLAVALNLPRALALTA